MSVVTQPVWLLEVASGAPAESTLMHSITEQQLVDWEGEWLPELFKAIQRMKRSGVERSHWPQSRHWNWRRKTETLQPLLAHSGFAVVCNGVTQGLMIVDTTTHRCRLDGQKGEHVVYVEYVENAPWNRRELLYDPPRYRGIGSILVRAAIGLSLEEEFKGRIGLHSLPQANDFYANTCGMTDLGVDPDPDYSPMRYFEMTPEQAEAFVVKGEPS